MPQKNNKQTQRKYAQPNKRYTLCKGRGREEERKTKFIDVLHNKIDNVQSPVLSAKNMSLSILGDEKDGILLINVRALSSVALPD